MTWIVVCDKSQLDRRASAAVVKQGSLIVSWELHHGNRAKEAWHTYRVMTEKE